MDHRIQPLEYMRCQFSRTFIEDEVDKGLGLVGSKAGWVVGDRSELIESLEMGRLSLTVLIHVVFD